jgi:lysophospholipase L1-like esterase
MLTALFEPDIAVANHAESGETLKSFVTELRFDKLLSQVKAGDWLLIQFGHNDQKVQWPQTYADPEITYPAWLRTYIAEARRRGAHPVLVTSPERRNYQGDGTVRRTLAEYGEAARRVAREERIPLLDLQERTVALYEALGDAKAANLFNDRGKDRTHHNNAGAWFLARALAAEIAAQIPELAAHLKPAARRFDAANPDLDERFVDASLAESDVRPAGN